MSIIIKKNYLITIIHIVVFLGVGSLLLWIPRILYYITVVDFSWMNIFYGIFLIVGILSGLLITGKTVISCILFGMKQCIINSDGVVYCSWKRKKLSWKEIKEIELEESDTYIGDEWLVSHDLLLYTENKKIKIDMCNTSLKVDPYKLYKQCKRYQKIYTE
ncbi:hypothetical protein [Lactococcus petauri]|uniref:hypothetical protein n=1 Tax=Lactococcus petauri TaxID=1940789 RepID=UPI0031FEA051